MTTPKINTVFRGGSRYYERPDTGEKAPGVTSILNTLPKPFLKPWASKLTAEAAVRAIATSGTYTDSKGNFYDLAAEPDWLTPMVEADPAAAIDFLKKAADRFTKKRADEGTAAHGVFESLLWGRPLGKVTPTMEAYARQFDALLTAIGGVDTLRTEDTVWSEKHNYAGSFDALGGVQGELAWIDNKTTADVHAEVAIQLSAYAHADYVLDAATGDTCVLPEAQRGLVFHVKPDMWAVYEAPIGDDVFAYFLHLREIFEWDRGSRKVLGKPKVQGAAVIDE